MRRTVFYSWQSDLDPKFNRNLIEDALERALRAIKRDEVAAIEPVLDRDTSGTPGSPAIADTIFNKIATADVFVADVSIINSGTKKDAESKRSPGARLCNFPTGLGPNSSGREHRLWESGKLTLRSAGPSGRFLFLNGCDREIGNSGIASSSVGNRASKYAW